MPKVYISGTLGGYWPHALFGSKTHNFDEALRNPDDITLVVLTGGADINPAIYNHRVNKRTHFDSSGDARDLKAIDFALKYEIPIAGICRGGQMLIARAGGFLYQDVTNHGRSHLVKTREELEFMVTSCHHQMYGWPLPKSAELLAWASPRISNRYELSDSSAPLEPYVEPECVWLPDIRALATQWHPEWMDQGFTAGANYYQFLLKKYIVPALPERFKKIGKVVNARVGTR